MNPSDEDVSAYSLDITARVTGLSVKTILHYQEQGFIRPLPDAGGTRQLFDDEALRTLRRIEHLRSTCGVNEAGLRLILHLIDEVERLRG